MNLEEKNRTSKIRFLHANPFYNTYLDKFYKERPGLGERSYSEQYKLIMEDSFALADFWKKNLEKTGKFECTEIISNWPVIQKRWANENNIKFSEKSWAIEILTAQINHYKPEVIFIRDLNTISPGFALEIKKKFSFIKLIMAWDGVGKNNPELLEGFDIVLSCIPGTVDFYNENGFRSYLLQHGFENSILEKLGKVDKDIECSFVGSVGMDGKHKNRLELLAHLCRKTKIEIFAPSLPSTLGIIRTILGRIIKNDFKNIPTIKSVLNMFLVKINSRPGVFGLEMYKVLRRSRVTLNMHIEEVGSSVANMRLFEATGVGTCLLTDDKENLGDYFEIEKEIFSYKDKDDCVRKINFLLQNPEKREQTALLGQKKTLERFNLEKIIGEFANTIINNLSQK